MTVIETYLLVLTSWNEATLLLKVVNDPLRLYILGWTPFTLNCKNWVFIVYLQDRLN